MSQLHLVCRVSGRRFSALSRPERYPVTEWKAGLLACFGVNAYVDAEGVHPPSVCHLCLMVMRRWQEAATAGRPFTARGGCGSPRDWEPHRRSGCKFCEQRSARGRPAGSRKRRRSGSDIPETAPGRKLLCATPNDLGKEMGVVCADEEEASAHDLPVEGEPIFPVQIDESAAHSEENNGISSNSVGASLSNNQEPNKSLEQLMAFASPKYAAGLELSSERVTMPLPPLECPVCRCVADGAVFLQCCQQHCCTNCIFIWLRVKLECPRCRRPLDVSDLSPPTTLFLRLLPCVTLACDFAEQGCPASVPLTSLRAHVARCNYRLSEKSGLPLITGETKVKVLANLPADTTFTHDMEVAMSSLIKLKECHSGVQGRIEVYTGGRRKIWHSVRQGNVPSNAASEKTLRQRTQELLTLRTEISGGKKGAQAQLSHELSCVNKVDRDAILTDLGMAPGSLSTEQALVMKADLRLPWSKLGKLMQWLNEVEEGGF